MVEKYSDQEVTSKFNRAQNMSKKGDLNGARAILEELRDNDPESSAITAVLAGLLWRIGDLLSAEELFIRAVEIAPKSEKISLGLFHCLMDLGKEDEAFEEMKRFTNSSESPEYKRLVEEINNSDR